MINTNSLRADCEVFAEAVEDLKPDLSKYPNGYRLVYQSALYSATSPDSPLLKRALELAEEAIECYCEQYYAEPSVAAQMKLDLKEIREAMGGEK